ncbi:MAG: N-succinylarginine dihydrolase [Thermoleophilia bacterium]
MTAVEVNFDGLIGPTHNYAGLGPGNLASQRNRGEVSNPRAAALQGIAKMRRMVALGVPQGVLPPQERPDVQALRAMGFDGDDGRVLAAAGRDAPHLLAACASASSMWAANAATVRPGADGADGRVHMVPANLVAALHRSLEAVTTTRVLRRVFPEARVYEPLPASVAMGDEGAANHSRVCAHHGGPGVHVFVHGADRTGRFRARQSADASRAVARLLGVAPDATVHVAQSPAAVDAGAFHNDVVCVGHRDVMLVHEAAFDGGAADLARIDAAARRVCGVPLRAVVVPGAEVSLDDAVASYLFNSQLVSSGDGRTVLVAPAEVHEVPAVHRWVTRAMEDPDVPLDALEVVDVRESMRNGGGPACLRLRVVLTDVQLAQVATATLMDAAALDALEGWVRRHHRDRLAPDDLRDPALLGESRTALDELTAMLGLGAVYPFQR